MLIFACRNFDAVLLFLTRATSMTEKSFELKFIPTAAAALLVTLVATVAPASADSNLSREDVAGVRQNSLRVLSFPLSWMGGDGRQEPKRCR